MSGLVRVKNVLHTWYRVKTNVEADLLTGQTEDFVCQISKKKKKRCPFSMTAVMENEYQSVKNTGSTYMQKGSFSRRIVIYIAC